VCARLFGLKILTIDAQVVHGHAAELDDVVSGIAQVQAVPPLFQLAKTRSDAPLADLAYAVRLLEEGSRILDESRRMNARVWRK
jgi:hypothetical protein